MTVELSRMMIAYQGTVTAQYTPDDLEELSKRLIEEGIYLDGADGTSVYYPPERIRVTTDEATGQLELEFLSEDQAKK